MLFLALLFGCTGGISDPHGDQPDPLDYDEGEPCLRISPRNVDFGEVSALDGEYGTVILSLKNACEGTLELDEILLEDPDQPFDLGLVSTPAVDAGEMADLSVCYRPASGGKHETHLLIYTNDPDTPESMLKVQGLAMAPRVELDPAQFDFGSPHIGCEAELPLTVTNSGTMDMVVSEVEVVESSGEYWAEHSDLPWTLFPGESRTLYAHYRPVDDIMDVASVYVVTDDPGLAVISSTLSGSGIPGERTTDSFVFQGGGKVDYLFTVDRNPQNTARASALAAAIPDFTDKLDRLGVDWQVGAVVNQDGCVLGDAGYIDSASASSAKADFLEMIDLSYQLAAYTGWSLRGFAIATSALGKRSACNADLLRSGADLAVVHFASYDEMSGTQPATYVSDLQAKSPDVVVHALAGDVPGGCGAGTQAGARFQTATGLTGGEFLSICTTADYVSHLEDIAEASVGATGRLTLVEQAVPGTVSVKVDGSVVTTGWSFCEATNSVTFDGSALPPNGSTVDISYALVPEVCP